MYFFPIYYYIKILIYFCFQLNAQKCMHFLNITFRYTHLKKITYLTRIVIIFIYCIRIYWIYFLLDKLNFVWIRLFHYYRLNMKHSKNLIKFEHSEMLIVKCSFFDGKTYPVCRKPEFALIHQIFRVFATGVGVDSISISENVE